MSTNDPSGKSARREEARAKARQMQAEAEAAERRRRMLIVGLIAAVVLAIAGGIGVAVQRNSKSKEAADANFGATGAITLPAPTGSKAPIAKAATVRIYGDFLCPNCKNFETETGSYLAGQQKDGNVKLEFVPVSILNRLSQGTEYSSRAAGAAFCVATADPTKTDSFIKAMYAAQPAENTAGLTNQEILEIAKTLIPKNSDLNTCITNNRYQAYADKVTDQASKDGLQGTPTVWVNGKNLTFTNDSPMLAQLMTAVKNATGTGTATPAPTTSATKG